MDFVLQFGGPIVFSEKQSAGIALFALAIIAPFLVGLWLVGSYRFLHQKQKGVITTTDILATVLFPPIIFSQTAPSGKLGQIGALAIRHKFTIFLSSMTTLLFVLVALLMLFIYMFGSDETSGSVAIYKFGTLSTLSGVLFSLALLSFAGTILAGIVEHFRSRGSGAEQSNQQAGMPETYQHVNNTDSADYQSRDGV